MPAVLLRLGAFSEVAATTMLPNFDANAGLSGRQRTTRVEPEITAHQSKA